LAIVLLTTPYLLQLDRRRHQRRRPRQRPLRTGICEKEIGDVGHQAAMSVLRNLAIDCRPPPSSLRSPAAAPTRRSRHQHRSIIVRPDRLSSIVAPNQIIH
jgi:hypothetical protein